MNEYLDLQFEPTEAILVEVAIRIQLPPSRHELAVERYRAISDYLEREGSPLKDLIARFYPQGSMAIRATIASGTSDNDYDIDIVAELLLPANIAPETALDLMFRAIRGERGSRYYGMTKRRSRCVTVYYADGMHLDITPVVLNAQRSPRTSYLFHDDPDKPEEDSATLLMNAWGFCEWFKSNTDDDSSFASRYAEMARSLDFEAKADAEPVDPQEDPALKGTDVIVLQLIKRFLNLRYEDRRGRKPPSVLLSKWVADNAIRSNSILTSASHHVRLIRRRLSDAERREEVVHESNPACHEDCFTDRWPLTRSAQQLALEDLTEFQNALDQLASGNLSIEETQDLLIELFGDLHVREAVKSIQRSAGREMREGRTRHRSGGGMRVGSAAAASTGRTARRNTYYGGELDEP